MWSSTSKRKILLDLCPLCRAISSHVGGNFLNLQFRALALFLGIKQLLLRDILGHRTMSISSKCVQSKSKNWLFINFPVPQYLKWSKVLFSTRNSRTGKSISVKIESLWELFCSIKYCVMIFIMVPVNPLEYQEKCIWWKNYERPERGNCFFVSNILFMIMLHGPWTEKLDLKHNWPFATPRCYKWRLFILAICDVSTGKWYFENLYCTKRHGF